MAEQTLSLDFTWENGVGFKITQKKNSDPKITVLQAEENGKIAELWSAYQEAIERFVKHTMADIGKEMAAE